MGLLTVLRRMGWAGVALLLILCLVACGESAARPTPTPPPAPTEPPATLPTATPTLQPTPPPPPTLTPAPTPDGPPIGELPPGWTRIEPGGETACAYGTPYAFWVRPGTSGRLMVFFEGGGGCWNAATCRAGSGFFDAEVGVNDGPEGQGGIFALDNPENPFRDDTMLFIPYCTGDVHTGNKTQTYRDEQGEVTIRHNGFVNASAALDWTMDRLASPAAIMATGCSAGSIGSVFHAPYLIERFPGTRFAQLGDSEAFVFGRPIDLQTDWNTPANFPAWIPALADLNGGNFTMARFYLAVATHYPQARFAQYNTAHDAIQRRFFLAANLGAGSWETALLESLDEIEAGAPNFASYLAPGSSHCILPYDRFYTTTVAGQRFRDWMAALANGEAVGQVRCTQCEE